MSLEVHSADLKEIGQRGIALWRWCMRQMFAHGESHEFQRPFGPLKKASCLMKLWAEEAALRAAEKGLMSDEIMG